MLLGNSDFCGRTYSVLIFFDFSFFFVSLFFSQSRDFQVL